MTTKTSTNLPEFTLGDRLRKAREWAGLTQLELYVQVADDALAAAVAGIPSA